MITYSNSKIISVLAAFTVAAVLSACSGKSNSGSGGTGGRDSDSDPGPTAGASALGTPAISLEDVVKRIKAGTGTCNDAAQEEQSRLSRYLTDTVFKSDDYAPLAKDWAGFVSAYASCKYEVPGNTAYLRIFFFRPGSFADVQRSWKAASSVNRNMYFGNGYAVSVGGEEQRFAVATGMRHLVCGKVETIGAKKIPADVEGCVFTDARS